MSEHPFAADPGDHCETPIEAYADIAPLLRGLAFDLGKTPETLRIYDPYYCEGSVVRHLGSLGFSSVHNVNEDFYANIAAGTTPEFDVIVTNPPYSGDHVRKIVRYCRISGKPWFLCVPTYVHTSHGYRQEVSAAQSSPLFSAHGPTLSRTDGAGRSNSSSSSSWYNNEGDGSGAKGRGGGGSGRPVVRYVVPRRRYAYWCPGGIRGRAMAVSPFESVWHVCLVGSNLNPNRNANPNNKGRRSKPVKGKEPPPDYGRGGSNVYTNSGLQSVPGPATMRAWDSLGKSKGGLGLETFDSLAEMESAAAGKSRRPQVARTPKRPNPKARKRAAKKAAATRASAATTTTLSSAG